MMKENLKEFIENKLDKKKIVLKMTNNSLWAIPVYVVVLNEAQSVLSKSELLNVSTLKNKCEDIIRAYNYCDTNILDWVTDKMYWKDVVEEAYEVHPNSELDFDSELATSIKDIY